MLGLSPFQTAIAFLPTTIAAVLVAMALPRLTSEDTGAASGLVNVAHQIGNSLGLGILVAIFEGAPAGHGLLTQRIAASFVGAAAMLAVALIVAAVLVVRRAR